MNKFFEVIVSGVITSGSMQNKDTATHQTLLLEYTVTNGFCLLSVFSFTSNIQATLLTLDLTAL